jgi:alpha-beta hydrolase superfamily lysophospholipase
VIYAAVVKLGPDDLNLQMPVLLLHGTSSHLVDAGKCRVTTSCELRHQALCDC